MLKRIVVPSFLSVVLLLPLSVSGQQTWTVNFKDSDIQEVIKFIADVTGRTIIIDPRVKGRVKVISSKPLTEEELLDLFRTVLEVSDFTTIDSDGLIRVVPMKDARSSPVPVTDGETSEEGFITQVIQLQNIAAAKVLPVIRPLVPQHSHLAAYDPANAIVISDFKANIDRIRDLIERIDKSAMPVTEIVELKYANAEDMVSTLDKLEKNQQKASSASANKVSLIADKRNNAILVTGEDLQRERIKQLIRRLDRPKAQSGSVRVIYLNYAKAKPTAEILTKVVANMSKLGPAGGDSKATKQTGATVEADEDTNALLITAEGDTLDALLEVVARLDIRRAQVLVEAIIVELNEDTGRNLGFEYFFREKEEAAFGSSVAGDSAAGILGVALQGATEEGQESGSDEDIQNLTNLAGALAGAGQGQIFGLLGTNEDIDFGMIIKALESDTKSNVLSTPTLLTMDNNEASFSVGQNVPFVTGSFTNTGTGTASPFQTIQRQDVGITLKVTPHVNEGDKVILDIAQEVSSISPSASASDVITNQRKIETQVMAADGEIIVMGGLMQDEANQSEGRVPILGRLPLVGRFFRSSTKNNTVSNMAVFIRASIIREDEELTGATAEKYRYIRERQLELRKQGFLRFKNNNMPLMPELSEFDLPYDDKPYKVEKVESTDNQAEGEAGEAE